MALRLGNERVGALSEREPISKRLVFLKDSWRISGDGMEKEADIYKELKDCGVSFIPSVLCAGDVICDELPQRTQTER